MERLEDSLLVNRGLHGPRSFVGVGVSPPLLFWSWLPAFPYLLAAEAPGQKLRGPALRGHMANLAGQEVRGTRKLNF